MKVSWTVEFSVSVANEVTSKKSEEAEAAVSVGEGK